MLRYQGYAYIVGIIFFTGASNFTSAQPLPEPLTSEAFFSLRTLPEPLVPHGSGESPAANLALQFALARFEAREAADDFSALENFIASHPDSPWRLAVETNLGLLQYRAGYFSRCITSFHNAWETGKNASDAKARALADRAVAEYTKMLARLGRYEELTGILNATKNREFSGAATELMTAGMEGVALMKEQPDKAFRCGSLALSRILASVNSPRRTDAAIVDARSTVKGMSLSEVAAISRAVGLNYQPARRSPGASFIFPSVIHWKAGHYAALIKAENGTFLTEDPTFGNETWHTRTAIEDEASGYFLVPEGSLPEGWSAVPAQEAGKIYGKGRTSGNDGDDNKPTDEKDGGDCQGGKGMATYAFHSMLVSLNIVDTPVGYAPPYGPRVDFTVTYSQREAGQPSNFNYSNLGEKWMFNWLSHIVDSPSNPAIASQRVAGGGTAQFGSYDAATSSFAPEYDSQNVLKRVSTNPVRYELQHPDGSVDVFGKPDGSTVSPRKVFLTERRDPSGNAVALTYDAQLRITHITDAIGQATTISYEHPTDAYKITKVTDPFGRQAIFTYTGGRLTKIRDVIGLESSFTYQGATSFIDSLATPYGTTQFTTYQSGRVRRLTATNPQGDKEVLEFNEDSDLQPNSDPNAKLPAGMFLRNTILYARNSYFWDRKAWKEHPEDYSKARLTHWLHTEDYTQADNAPESRKNPYENRVWYNYPGQPANNEGATEPGTLSKPSKVGMRLDDGSTELRQYAYNTRGRMTSHTDEVGRTTLYEYENNGIDLKSIKQQTAGGPVTLVSYTWNNQHLPLTHTDAAGQMTVFAWNPQGQVTSITNARGDATSFAYYQTDAPGKQRRGRLHQINGALPGDGDTVTLDYEATGKVAQVTAPDGHFQRFEYDLLDRLTRVTYPDDTFLETTYTKLDPETFRDRLGRITRYVYNSIRQLESVTDPANRMIGYKWCKCGDLAQIIDAMGRVTRWKHDAQGRVTAKIYIDGSTINYAYSPDNGLLKSVTDEKGQVKTRRYYLDQTLAGIAYTQAEHHTPDVTFTYDTEFRRLKTMVDGIGTTQYSYHPNAVGALGAGQLSSIDGSLANDTLAFEYDELTRRVGYTLNGVGESRTFDPLGRLLTVTNPLGAFTYTYEGASSRTQSVTYPGGMVCKYNYHSLLKDFLLKDIIHTLPGNALLSRHAYEYNVMGNITRWTQVSPQAGINRSWLCGYDDADQLASVASQDPDTLANLPAGQYAYTYDPAGNRLTETIDGATTTATYNSLNQLMGLSGNGTSLLPQQTYEWDAENRLVAINSPIGNRRSEFQYDGVGRRTAMIEQEGQDLISHFQYVWHGFGIREERVASTNIVQTRYHEHGVQVSKEVGLDSPRFLLRDHLHSGRIAVSTTNTITATYDFDPWGRKSTTGDAGEDPNVAFTGHAMHATSKLTLAPFRAYDSTFGRWASRDPIAENGGINLYVYGENNPINKTDPLGLEVGYVGLGFGMGEGGVLSGSVGLATDLKHGRVGLRFCVGAGIGLYGTAMSFFGEQNIESGDVRDGGTVSGGLELAGNAALGKGIGGAVGYGGSYNFGDLDPDQHDDSKNKMCRISPPRFDHGPTWSGGLRTGIGLDVSVGVKLCFEYGF